MSDYDDFQREVGEWAERIFGKATPASVLAHLTDEVIELCQAEGGAPMSDDPKGEAADVYLLLLHYAHKRGFSLYSAAAEKFKVNQARTWGDADDRRVVRHVEEGRA